MRTPEKILMIELLLRDIRGNWGWELFHRAEKAKELCMSISNEVQGMDTLANSIKEYIDEPEKDGRFFRIEYPLGYEDMEQLHEENYNIKGKSKEFVEIAKKYLTHPEYRFDDWRCRNEANK